MKTTEKMWRTLVRIQSIDFDKQIVTVVIPGWDTKKSVDITFECLPKHFREKIVDLRRVFAEVNVGAETEKDLKFSNFEI